MNSQGTPEPVRKSGRARRPTSKYANEAFTGLEALDPVSEHEAEAWHQLEQSSDDEEFDQVQAVEETIQLGEDAISSATESDRSRIPTPNEESDGAGSDLDADPNHTYDNAIPRHHPTVSQSYIGRRPRRRAQGTHVRGIADPVKYCAKGSRSDQIYQLFGNATEDLVHMARSRDQWYHEATLPGRSNRSCTSGMHHPFSRTEQKRQWEAAVGWDWYYDHGGQQHFANTQANHRLGADEGARYIPRPSDSPQAIFMGPYGRQSRFDLPNLQSIALNEAWEEAVPKASLDSADTAQPQRTKRRDGWMLNVGTGVRCVEWAPNHTRDMQYLAISTIQPRKDEKLGQSRFSPAFTAQSFPSSIQIWSFSSTEVPHRKSLLDPESPPCLQLVLCTDWGDAKHLRWCPTPRNFRNEGQEGGIPIGLLACVCSDGYVRVLDIHLDRPRTQNTSFVKVTAAAFTAKPPSTLCTCVTWLSPTDLAVGCANGYLAIWSIYPYPSPTAWPTPPVPSLYTPLHPSYISSLSTAYPLAPHLLATTSPSGYLRLTSLLSPQTDYVLSPRLRHPPSHVHFSEPCYAFVATDETETVRLWPIRRFFSPVSVAVCPSQGLALGVGSVHSSVIVGCVDGTVCVSNPLRRFLFPKLTSWQCPVFKHEFARGGRKAGDQDDRGSVRITEGFKLQEAGLLKGTGKKSVEGVPVSTIYEEEGQVRCVSWGTELGVGGWVAVGMGSGLVRVEDLAV
ncbi:MAG: hypothetical protein L6R40_001832 [Gallowayella cf. fulva]|nr:MAG: hypothetical protein L6R40_001832 [Xanthomendoza cf. fulva]